MVQKHVSLWGKDAYSYDLRIRILVVYAVLSGA